MANFSQVNIHIVNSHGDFLLGASNIQTRHLVFKLISRHNANSQIQFNLMTSHIVTSKINFTPQNSHSNQAYSHSTRH